MSDLGVALTIDVDWGGDAAIDWVAARLEDLNVPATWFATHDSPALDRMRDHPLFELGVHPNFMPGSTHGSTVEHVLENCMELVPEAKAVRAHGLALSSRILDVIVSSTPLEIDSSLLVLGSDVDPFELHWPERGLVRIASAWEDDTWLAAREYGGQETLWLKGRPRVVTFHPTLVAMNADSYTSYERVRSSYPQLTPRDLRQCRAASTFGAGDAFDQVVDQLAENGRGVTISGMRDRWKAVAGRST